MADPFKEAEVEELAFKLLFKDKKPITQTGSEMRDKGYEISDHALKKFKKEMFSRLVKEDNREKFTKSLLNSVERVTEEFDDLYDRTKRLVDKFESEGRDYEVLAGIRELREQITVALKKLGEFKTAINKIQAQEINIVNTPEFVKAIGRMQQRWFESMDAKMEDGKLVFEKPKAETVEAYRNWSARKKLSGKRTKV